MRCYLATLVTEAYTAFVAGQALDSVLSFYKVHIVIYCTKITFGMLYQVCKISSPSPDISFIFINYQSHN